MKFINNFSAFLPWIVYKLTSIFFPMLAIPLAIIVSLVPYVQLRKGFIMEWGSLLFFISAFISSQFFKNTWILENLSIMMAIFFFSVVTISLLINKPFTLQYAKLQAAETFWNHPIFLRVNKIMTSVLGLIFLIVTIINIYGYLHPHLINEWIVWTVALTIKFIFIKYFPNWYKKRYLKKFSDF